MCTKRTPSDEFPGWRVLEDIGAGVGAATKCERCGKLGTPRQHFTHLGVTVCFVCARERADELGSEGSEGRNEMNSSFDFDDLLAHLGAAEALRDDTDDFRKAVNRLWTERESLIENHPNMWVSMGKDGVVTIGDSIEEVVSATEVKGVSTADVIVEYLDSNPETLIL